MKEEDENDATDSTVSQAEGNDGAQQVGSALPSAPESEFRMSRVSDREAPPRTPSPMKAAYLQTGYSSPIRPTTNNRDFAELSSKTMQDKTTKLHTDVNNNACNMETQQDMNTINNKLSDDSRDELKVSGSDEVTTCSTGELRTRIA